MIAIPPESSSTTRALIFENSVLPPTILNLTLSSPPMCVNWYSAQARQALHQLVRNQLDFTEQVALKAPIFRYGEKAPVCYNKGAGHGAGTPTSPPTEQVSEHERFYHASQELQIPFVSLRQERP